MFRLLIVGLLAGLLFGTMDALIHANPWAQDLYAAYAPLARPDIRAVPGTVIDLFYGIVLAWLYVRLAPALPGTSALAKGLSYAMMLWFLRVFMGVAGEWVMYVVPVQTLVYRAWTGLLEMLVLGVVYAAAFGPKRSMTAAASAT